MKMTLGQVVAEIFAMFERRYGDPALAARATQVIVNDLLCRASERVAAGERAAATRAVPGTAQRAPASAQPFRKAA